jgi:hypothetical protein
LFGCGLPVCDGDAEVAAVPGWDAPDAVEAAAAPVEELGELVRVALALDGTTASSMPTAGE